MCEMLYKIVLTDVGDFLETDNPNDLDLDCSINVMYGVLGRWSKVVNNIIHKDYTLTPNDKFYFLPGVVIPRIKLKDINNTHNIRTVRDIDAADRIFIGTSTETKMAECIYTYTCETTEFMNFVTEAFNNGKITDYYYDKIKDALEFYTSKVIITDYSTVRLMSNMSIPYRVSRGMDLSSKALTVIKDEYVDTFMKVQGKELYSEDSLLPYINGEDAVSIDQSMFNTLSDMFNSTDKDNHTLAMEVMSNADYTSSILYLLMLCNQHGHRMSERQTRNHVNFKALCKYLSVSNTSPSIGIDRMVDILIDKNQVTEEHMAVLLEEYKDELTTGETVYFRVKTICFDDRINELLNKEITLKIRDDYEVKAVESTEELVENNNPITPIDNESGDFSFF